MVDDDQANPGPNASTDWKSVSSILVDHRLFK